jgi:mRNA-degrading endonuclease RelE of RelBE toxin-antitoxin system
LSAKSTSLRWAIEWSEHAKSDLRLIDRTTALDILHCVDRYLIQRDGDVKQLRPPLTGLRLRCGDYRIFFRKMGENGIFVRAVRHRSEAYRNSAL